MSSIRQNESSEKKYATECARSWREVAAIWNHASGQRISHRRVMQIAEMALEKIRKALAT